MTGVAEIVRELERLDTQLEDDCAFKGTIRKALEALRQSSAVCTDRRPHKTMTPEEYAAMPLIGWHEVCRDVDGFGGVGIRFLGEPSAATTDAAIAKVRLDGAVKRGLMMLDAKNHWRDRALAAEAERDRIKAFLSDAGYETIQSEQAWKARAEAAEARLAEAAKLCRDASERELAIFEGAQADVALSENGRNAIQDRALGRNSLAIALLRKIKALSEGVGGV